MSGRDQNTAGSRAEAPQGPFIGLARVQTMLKDFDALRRAIRQDVDIEAADRALDRCERWFDCIDPNANRKNAA